MTNWDQLDKIAVHRVGGAKDVARGHNAVASTDNAIATETALRIFRKGGNAADAAVATALVQSTNQQYVTNHTGLVTALYYDAKSRTTYQLESVGTFPSHLPVHRPNPIPAFPGSPPGASCIPHQMHGLGALHARFGSLSWAEVCEDAVYWADRGHSVTEIESKVFDLFSSSVAFFPETRAHTMPDGRVPYAGEHWRSADLAYTMKRLQAEGPAYFYEGEWAEKFVAKANELGWGINLKDMNEVQAAWIEPKRWHHKGIDVVQLAPPQVQAALCALTLGILNHLGTSEKGHYTQSAEALFDFAYATRRAHQDIVMINDPACFDGAYDVFFDEGYHHHCARLIDGNRPKVDLTNHVNLTSGPIMRRAGYAPTADGPKKSISGSCETSFVDADGNWCQMMNTFQSGGMPGVVVGGVLMQGSHAPIGSIDPATGSFGGYLAPGARLRMPLANTLLFKDGEPWMGVGTTGNCPTTPPQMLYSLIDCGMDPTSAMALPRMNMFSGGDLSVVTEGGIPDAVVDGMATYGIRMMQTLPLQIATGSYSITERDPDTGKLNAYADPRLGGLAAGV